jgi:hypothetical protein
MDKNNLNKAKVYFNENGKRVIKKVLVFKENVKTIWVVLADNKIIKRTKKRDLIN